MDNRIIDLLIKKKLDGLSLKEHSELTKLLAGNGGEENIAQTLEDFWEQPLPYKVNPEKKIDPDKLWKRVQQKINYTDIVEIRPKKYHWLKITAIAASLVFILGIAFLYFEKSKNEVEQSNVVVTKKGSKSFVILPDGSKVWINNDSKLLYANFSDRKTREVTLIGEAYFDVVKDKTKPFIVHTTHADVRVLGTAFNVKAYASEPTTETTLLRGAVELTVKGKDPKRIALIPNQKLIISNKFSDNSINHQAQMVLLNIKKTIADTLTNETQWVANKLTFDQERLIDIVPVLERWYNVKIELKISQSDKKISGTFENRSITDVLDAIQFACGFKYKIKDGNQVTIFR